MSGGNTERRKVLRWHQDLSLNKSVRAVALVFLCAGLSLFAADKELPFAIGEWSPYTGESLPGRGYAVQIVSAVCREAGFVPRFEFYPWPRAELYASEGRVFATFPFLRIPERESAFLFSEPIIHSSIGILRLASDEKTRPFIYDGSPSAFHGYTVGTLAGTLAVTEPLKKAEVAVVATSNLEQSLRMLEKRRVDFVLDERIVLADAVRRSYPDRPQLFSFIDRDFTAKRGYLLLVSKKYPDSAALMARFNAALAKLRANGALESIRVRYGL